MAKNIFIISVLPVFLLILAADTHGSAWTAGGIPVCTAEGIQLLPSMIEDGDGGAIIVWQDGRIDPTGNYRYNLYAQRIDLYGRVAWIQDGALISISYFSRKCPRIISDNRDGAIIVWQDERNNIDTGDFLIHDDIYAQRIDGDGGAVWQENGIPICELASLQEAPRITMCPEGGAIITWIDQRNGERDIYIQRVDSIGNCVWDINGMAICTAEGLQFDPRMLPDGDGGAIVAWYDYRNGYYDIYAQRINGAGDVLWNLDGIDVCPGAWSQINAEIVADNLDGAIITWSDYRSENNDIYAQRIDENGESLWSLAGIPVCVTSGEQLNPEIVTDGSSGAIIVWDDYRNDRYEVYAQRIDSSGIVLWQQNGVVIAAMQGVGQGETRVVSDMSGGAIITWCNASSDQFDIYTQRVDGNGIALWRAGGLPVCVEAGGQGYPQIVTDGLGGAIVAWNDSRSGSCCDIYAQKITSSGLIGKLTDIVLESPNGGEALSYGEQFPITWFVEGRMPDSVGIILSLDGGSNFTDTIATGLIDVDSYTWSVSQGSVTTARMKVVAYLDGHVEDEDVSDHDFRILGRPYRYVSPSGGNVYPYSVPHLAAHNIQNAVDAASNGDTIMVAEGVYIENVMIDFPVRLLGGWDGTFTVRDPRIYESKVRTNGSVISFMNVGSGSCGIEGFTITEGTGENAFIPGYGTYGGGIFTYLSSPVIRGNRIERCGCIETMEFSGGGGIACYGGDVTIEGNEIVDCTAQFGGGIYLFQATASIRNNRISGSTPSTQYSGIKNGGGVYALSATADFEGNEITKNCGYSNGGGIYCRLGTVTLDGDTISLNDCTDSGGGIHSAHSPLTVSNAVIMHNAAASTGGGVYHRAGYVDISNSAVVLNNVGIVGGGVYADSAWGGFVNNTIDRNMAVYGGGNIFFRTIVSLDFINNLITFGHENGFQADALDNISMQFNNAFGNTPDDFHAVIPDSTNMSRDPLYADTASLDYHLLVHSAGIDAGDPGIIDPDGSRSDQGAYGGPCAVMAAPEYVKNLSAQAVNDTTIQLAWDHVLSDDIDYYAVYGDTNDRFMPDETVLIGAVPVENNFIYLQPGPESWYYRVSAVNGFGYGGGYSNQAAHCMSGNNDAPVIAIIHPNGGETFISGDTISIEWEIIDNLDVDSVKVYFSEDAGGRYTLIGAVTDEHSIHKWIVPPIVSELCLIKIVARGRMCLAGEDTSNEFFSINGDNGTGNNASKFTNSLMSNYPNPFNPNTTIRFSLESGQHARLAVFDVSGHVVTVLADRHFCRGSHSVIWNGLSNRGRPVSSGIYFCRLVVGDFVQTKKMILLR